MPDKKRPTKPATTAIDLEDKLTPDERVVLNGILCAVETLYRRHIGAVMKSKEEEGSDKVRITFPVTLDYSEMPPSIRVDLRWSLSMSDTLVSELPDPNQPEFNFVTIDEAKVQRMVNAERRAEAGDA